MKYFVCFFLIFSVLIASHAYAANINYYCFDSYDEYREMRYWAKASLTIYDYQSKSGDVVFLNLIDPKNSKSLMYAPNEKLQKHFNNAFASYVKGKLPFHNTDEGRDERFAELYKKYGKDDDFFDMLQAYEEARRESEYGSNPASLYCSIKVKRRDLPVLFEIKCNITTNMNLTNYNGLKEVDIGYSTAEHIEGTIKRMLTEHLKSLGDRLSSINSCKQ